MIEEWGSGRVIPRPLGEPYFAQNDKARGVALAGQSGGERWMGMRTGEC
jgi:hypothetical protein